MDGKANIFTLCFSIPLFTVCAVLWNFTKAWTMKLSIPLNPSQIIMWICICCSSFKQQKAFPINLLKTKQIKSSTFSLLHYDFLVWANPHNAWVILSWGKGRTTSTTPIVCYVISSYFLSLWSSSSLLLVKWISFVVFLPQSSNITNTKTV